MLITTLASPETVSNDPTSPPDSSMMGGETAEQPSGLSYLPDSGEEQLLGPPLQEGATGDSRPGGGEGTRPRPSLVRGGRTGLLTPTGPLNGAAAAALVAQIRAVTAACRSLIVDLRRVDYVDSQGAKALLALRDAVGEAGGRLRLVIAEGSPVERTLRLLRFDGLFPIFRRAADAWRVKEKRRKRPGKTRDGIH